jgi:hypothetical protein
MRKVATLLLVAFYFVSTALAANPPASISFELVTRPGLPLTASQQWYKTLTSLGVSGLRIRQANSGDEASIEKQGTDSAPRYRVVGILAADNVLHLPGGKFKASDTDRLRKWLARVGDEGPEGVTEQRAAFGLTPRQLSELQDDLKRPVRFVTADLVADKVVARIGKGLKLPLVVDAEARRKLAAVKVSDDLQDLSSGTALAAVLRPAGLALLPERPSGGELQLRVIGAQAGVETWPIGWKTKTGADKPLAELFEFLNVEIKETSVAEAIAAIQARVKAPFLFDSGALARHGIDPAAVQADVPEKRMTYSQILGKVLMQARLKYELRVDDADKPFVWITTVKPA